MTDAYFRRTLESTMGSMERVALSVLKNAHDAQDAAQEAGIRAWRKRDKIDPAKLSGYLVSATYNCAVDKLRTRTVTREAGRPADIGFAEWLDLQTVRSQAKGGSGRAEDVFVNRLFAEQIMASLTPEMRQLFTEHFIEGKAMAEIGRETGTPMSTIKPRIYRALDRIRKAHPEQL